MSKHLSHTIRRCLRRCCAAQSLVDIVKHGLVDENQKVKTITALTVSALAEAAAPYGIESFDDVLEPLWKGIRLLRGKARSRLTSLGYACCMRFFFDGMEAALRLK